MVYGQEYVIYYRKIQTKMESACYIHLFIYLFIYTYLNELQNWILFN